MYPGRLGLFDETEEQTHRVALCLAAIIDIT